MTLRLTILGCGSSGGVPAIGNNWGRCDPAEPKNDRTRASIAIQSDNSCLLVDTGPDCRMQVNRAGIESVDAVLYTHAHGDHVAGIDELRSFQRRDRRVMPIYGHQETIDELLIRFAYMFHETGGGIYPPALDATAFTPDQYCKPQEIAGISVMPFEQDHTTCTSLGFRFGDIAYCTDMHRLSEESLEAIKGVRVWIVDAAGHYFKDNIVHISIPQVIEMNEEVGAEEVYLTHLSLMMDYQALKNDLPAGFFPCYDGLKFETKG